MRSHSATKSAISSTEDILHNPLVQLWFSNCSLTMRCFLQANLYKRGAISLGALPCNQDASQNLAVLPFPTVTIVDALKSCRSTSFTGKLPPTHGRSGSFHSNHNQRSLSALLNLSRSRTPSPPNFFSSVHFLPLHQAATTIFLVCSLPKKTTSNLIDLFDCLFLQLKHR